MRILKLRKIIEKELRSIYGEELKFGLLKIKEDELILITPFIDNENNLIEISIFQGGNESITINDLGKIHSYLMQLNNINKNILIDSSILNLLDSSRLNHADGAENENMSFSALVNLNFFQDGFFEINTDIENIGSDIKRLLLLLQKTYSLKPESEITDGFNITQTYAREEDFKSEFINILEKLNLKFIEDSEITGISGDKKIINFIIKGKKTKYINIFSGSKVSEAKDIIKISFADFYDLKSFKISFCLVFDDKKYPAVWHELKKTGILNLLKKNNINFYGFFQDYSSLKQYLIN